MILSTETYFHSKIHYLACKSQNIFYSMFWLDHYSNPLIILKMNVGLDLPRVVSGNTIGCWTVYMQKVIHLFSDTTRKYRFDTQSTDTRKKMSPWLMAYFIASPSAFLASGFSQPTRADKPVSPHPFSPHETETLQGGWQEGNRVLVRCSGHVPFVA